MYDDLHETWEDVDAGRTTVALLWCLVLGLGRRVRLTLGRGESIAHWVLMECRGLKSDYRTFDQNCGTRVRVQSHFCDRTRELID